MGKIKGEKLCGLRFRREHPIDIFIADFYCHNVRLVIEIDGEIHKQQKEYDIGRSAEMEKYDIKVIRFSNEEVEFEIDKVIRIIERIVNDRISSPPWGLSAEASAQAGI